MEGDRKREKKNNKRTHRETGDTVPAIIYLTNGHAPVIYAMHQHICYTFTRRQQTEM